MTDTNENTQDLENEKESIESSIDNDNSSDSINEPIGQEDNEVSEEIENDSSEVNNSPEIPLDEANETPIKKKKKEEAKQEINNSRNIEKQVNVNSAGTIIVGQNRGDEESIGSKDPTTTFRINCEKDKFPDSLKQDTVISRNYSELEKERVLAISCIDKKVALDAAHLLVNYISAKDSTYKYRRLESKNRILTESDTFLHIQDFYSKSKFLGKAKNTVFIIDAENDDFFNSIIELTDFGEEGLKDHLDKDNNNNLIICLINSSQQISDWQNSTNYSQWNINFLDVLLFQHQNDFEKYKLSGLKIEIVKQQKQKHWGKNEEDFHHHVKGYLENNVLEEEVDKRNANGIELLKGYANEPQMLVDEEPILKHIALVITYFPSISLSELRKLVRIVLQDESVIQVIEKSGKKTKKKKQNVSCLEIWEEQPDELLQKCLVVSYEDEDNSELYQFSKPHLQEAFKKYYRGHNVYLHKKFAVFLNSAIYFQKNISAKLLHNLTSWFVEMSIKEPDEYGLKQIVETILEVELIENIKSSNNQELRAAIAQIDPKHRLYRLSILMSEMLKHSKLEVLIEQLLNGFIARGNHREVIELIRRLKVKPAFKLKWIKEVFNRGKSGLHQQAYFDLIYIGLQSPFEAISFLKTIRGWHPEKNLSFQRYSPSHHYSICFLIDYALNLKVEEYGVFPPDYPLFSNRNKKQKTVLSEDEKQIIEWLFHPNLSFSYNKIQGWFRVGTTSIEVIRGAVINKWFLIICGNSKKRRKEKSVEFFKNLLIEIIHQSKKKERSAIYEQWQQQLVVINQIIADVSKETVQSSLEFQEKERKIKNLKRQCKSIESLCKVYKKTIKQFKK